MRASRISAMSLESRKLADFLVERLETTGQASLVEMYAHYDFHHHALPATWRINKALAALGMPVSLTPDRLSIMKSETASTVQLSEQDVHIIAEQYRKSLGAR